MAWRPHGRAKVSSRNPRAFALCDNCEFLYNHDALGWQYEWAGSQIQNLKRLVCRRCMDIPQQQLRSIILPADPVPIFNARPPNYNAMEVDFRTTQDERFRTLEDGSFRVVEEDGTDMKVPP